VRHSLTIEGYSYCLRPVSIEDASFIVEARLEAMEKNKFIHVSPDISLQVKWINNYYDTPGDYYFVVVNKFTSCKEGLIAIYNIDNKKAELGRWVIKTDPLASVESFYLICRMAFEQLDLDEAYSRIAMVNKSVIAFHDSVKAKKRKIFPFSFEGETYDAVEYFIDKEHFFSIIKPKLDKILCSMSERNKRNI
jgi:RimJ/RimL family protein N-acetyltransferase